LVNEEQILKLPSLALIQHRGQPKAVLKCAKKRRLHQERKKIQR
jgi:hypothetical protein